jgi:flagellar biosynthesis protein FlhA
MHGENREKGNNFSKIKYSPIIFLVICISILLINVGVILYGILSIVQVYSSIIFTLLTFITISMIQIIILGKGTVRISEVATMFSLDSLPAKQMAIEEKLNKGEIDENDAKELKSNLQRECDFLGSMDGISKIFRATSVIIFVSIILYVIINIILNSGIQNIDNFVFKNIVICGIVSQCIIIISSSIYGRIIIKNATK